MPALENKRRPSARAQIITIAITDRAKPSEGLIAFHFRAHPAL